MLSKFKSRVNKIRFYIIWDGEKRAKFLKKNNILKNIGENCLFQSRVFPMDPKLLYIHDNVTIAANVTFCTHDAIRHVLMNMDEKKYEMNRGAIEIEDNVFIGIGSIILPNVHIGKNVIVAAGSIVTKDIPNNSIVAGNPAKIIGKFDDLKLKREKNISKTIDNVWDDFYQERSEKNEK